MGTIVNKLTVYGKSVDAFVKAAKGLRQKYFNSDYLSETIDQDLCFQQLVPLSKENLNLSLKEECEQAEEKLWGCKEGAIDIEVILLNNNSIQYTFLTQDCLCTLLLEELTKMFPGLNFILSWAAPHEVNRGYIHYTNGIVTSFIQDDKFELKVPWETIENYKKRFNNWVYWYYDNHDKTVKKTKPWQEITNYEDIALDKANYIVTRQNDSLAYTVDKFTAYRIRKAIDWSKLKVKTKHQYLVDLNKSKTDSQNSQPNLVA